MALSEMVPFNRALVTGGAGFIGSHLVEKLSDTGCDIIVLDDFSSGTLFNLSRCKPSRTKIIRGDINDEALVKAALKDVDVVFHEAAIVSVEQSIAQPEAVRHVNVEGTRRLLRLSASARVKKFVFASSAAVYGNSKDLPAREDAMPSPISPYGKHKMMSERDCMEMHREVGLETTILRYFNVYGPRARPGPYSGVITKFAEKLVTNESPVINGDGKQTRDFVFVDDVVSGNLAAVASKSSAGKLFNIGTGVPVTIERLACIESEIILGDQVIIPFDYQRAKVGDILHSFADMSRTKNELGFHATYSLEDGLPKFLSWLYPHLSEKFLVREKDLLAERSRSRAELVVSSAK
jgi:UDP-glucose 4-epimerase